MGRRRGREARVDRARRRLTSSEHVFVSLKITNRRRRGGTSFARENGPSLPQCVTRRRRACLRPRLLSVPPAASRRGSSSRSPRRPPRTRPRPAPPRRTAPRPGPTSRGGAFFCIERAPETTALGVAPSRPNGLGAFPKLCPPPPPPMTSMDPSAGPADRPPRCPEKSRAGVAPETAGRAGWLGGTCPSEPLPRPPPETPAFLSVGSRSRTGSTGAPSDPTASAALSAIWRAPSPPETPPEPRGLPKSPETPSSEKAGAYPCSARSALSSPGASTPMSIPPRPNSRCASHSPSASSAASARAAAAVPGGTGELDLARRPAPRVKQRHGLLVQRRRDPPAPGRFSARTRVSLCFCRHVPWPRTPRPASPGRARAPRRRARRRARAPPPSRRRRRRRRTPTRRPEAKARRSVASAELGSTVSAASATRAAFCASPRSSAHALTSTRHSSLTRRASALASAPSNASSYSTKRRACSHARSAFSKSPRSRRLARARAARARRGEHLLRAELPRLSAHVRVARVRQRRVAALAGPAAARVEPGAGELFGARPPPRSAAGGAAAGGRGADGEPAGDGGVYAELPGLRFDEPVADARGREAHALGRRAVHGGGTRLERRDRSIDRAPPGIRPLVAATPRCPPRLSALRARPACRPPPPRRPRPKAKVRGRWRGRRRRPCAAPACCPRGRPRRRRATRPRRTQSPALSSLFSRTPPTVLVLPVARSQRRAVKTLFCMLCAGCAWTAPPSACGPPPPCECAGCANPPMPNAKWGTACAGCACGAAGFPGASSAPACVEPPAESEGVGIMAPTVRDAAVFRADTGSGGAGRGRAGRDALKRRPAVFLRHARGALFPFRDRVARPTSEFARSGCAPPRRSAPSSTTRPPRTPTPPSADQPRPWMRVGAPANAQSDEKHSHEKAPEIFRRVQIAGKNARAPTCVFCTVCDVMVAESRVSLVRLFASSCSKNRERGPTFDLASTVCSQVLSRHRSRKARRLVRPPPPRMETLCR